MRLPEVSPGVGHEGEGLCAEEAGDNVALGSNERVLDGICNTNQRRKENVWKFEVLSFEENLNINSRFSWPNFYGWNELRAEENTRQK